MGSTALVKNRRKRSRKQMFLGINGEWGSSTATQYLRISSEIKWGSASLLGLRFSNFRWTFKTENVQWTIAGFRPNSHDGTWTMLGKQFTLAICNCSNCLLSDFYYIQKNFLKDKKVGHQSLQTHTVRIWATISEVDYSWWLRCICSF